MSVDRKKKTVSIGRSQPFPSDHDLDDDLELPQINDKEDANFQEINNIYSLNSQINSLKIEKQKIALQHEAALKSMEARNKQLQRQNTLKKREIANLNLMISKLQQQNMDMKQMIDSHRHQVQSLNRKTADFHHSIQQPNNPYGDASDLINELVAKDNEIKQLKNRLSTTNQANNRISLSQSGGIGGVQLNLKKSQSVTEKSQQEIKSLKQTIQDLKRKQIVYKRQYESMIQSKQDIIRKMSQQNDETSQKILDNKDRAINQLKKQIQQTNKQSQYYKSQAKRMSQRAAQAEEKMNKMSNQFNKQKQTITYAFEQQKQNSAKMMIEKVKKQLRERDQTIKSKQQNIFNLQSKILIQNQQIGKFKAEIASVTQLNSFLENANKQLDENKQKIQKLLYEKQKEFGELRQSYFKQITEYKSANIKQKSQSDRKYAKLEQQLMAQKYVAQKYEKQLKQKQNRNQNTHLKQQYALLDQIQQLRNDKSNLNHQLLDLQIKYKQQTQKLLLLQDRIVKQYENKVIQLQGQLKQLRNKTIEQKKQLIIQNEQNKQSLQTKYKKLQMIVQLMTIQKKQKNDEINRLNEQKLKKEGQFRQSKDKICELDKKIKQRNEDYKNLQILYDQLNDKYKRGVRDLQQQIQQMSSKIIEQKRKAQKRKIDEHDIEQAVAKHTKPYKLKIKQLQTQLDKCKTKKVQQSQATDQKLQKLTHQISTITKQRQLLQRKQIRTIKQKQQMHQLQKQKYMQLIHQLQQNNQILNHKIAILSNKEMINLSAIQNMQKQLNHVKKQYNMSVSEINQLLNKCKQLEEVSRESIQHMEMMRQKHDILNTNFRDVVNERNKMGEEINAAYDQINKLNRVLMSKQEQISKSRITTYQQVEQQAPTVTQNLQYVPTSLPISVQSVQSAASYRVSSSPMPNIRDYPTVSNLPRIPNVPSVTTYLIGQPSHRDHDCKLHEALNPAYYGEMSTSPRTIIYRT